MWRVEGTSRQRAHSTLAQQHAISDSGKAEGKDSSTKAGSCICQVCALGARRGWTWDEEVLLVGHHLAAVGTAGSSQQLVGLPVLLTKFEAVVVVVLGSAAGHPRGPWQTTAASSIVWRVYTCVCSWRPPERLAGVVRWVKESQTCCSFTRFNWDGIANPSLPSLNCDAWLTARAQLLIPGPRSRSHFRHLPSTFTAFICWPKVFSGNV